MIYDIFFINLLPLAIFCIPFFISIYPIFAFEGELKTAFMLTAPLIFLTNYLLISGLFSLPFHKAIIPGKFPRDLKNQVYGARRLYGLSWNAIYFFTPIYHLFLSLPIFKKLMFRLFGYKGDLKFIIYADTWLRDLPILSFGEDVYIANRSTIGTNMCLKDGSIFVDRITVGAKSIIGHLAVLGPGSSVGLNTEVGLEAGIGIRSSVKDNSKIGPRCGIHHGVLIGSNTQIGGMTYIGLKAVIGDNIKLNGGACIPGGAVINNQKEADNYFSSEMNLLNSELENLKSIFSADEIIKKIAQDKYGKSHT